MPEPTKPLRCKIVHPAGRRCSLCRPNKPEPTKPTCCWRHLYGPAEGCCADKPPERVEWERLLDEIEDGAMEALSTKPAILVDKLRAAVQRALDEREAATWRLAMKLQDQRGRLLVGPVQGELMKAYATAAEARAKGQRED